MYSCEGASYLQDICGRLPYTNQLLFKLIVLISMLMHYLVLYSKGLLVEYLYV